MLSFVLCDDNKSVLDRLSKILDSIFLENNIDAEIKYSSNTAEDTLNYIKSNIVDVLFLDIDLKSSLSGIDLANKIREFNKNIYIIFTSAHLEYILIAYKCKTFDFIPKPISKERVEETIFRLVDDVTTEGTTASFIRIDNKNTLINQDSVNFIKKEGMKLVFYTDTKTYKTYNSFNKIYDELPKNFVRCHKSYIANVNKITNINNTTIVFNNKDNISCNIGPKYKKELMEVLKNDGNFTNNLDSINYRKRSVN